jgi:hypothetical protein
MKYIFSLGFGIRHGYDTFFFGSIWFYAIGTILTLIFKSYIPIVNQMDNNDIIFICQLIWLLPLSIVALIKLIRHH